MQLNEDLNSMGVESFAAVSRSYGSEGVYLIGNEKSIKLHGLLSRLSGKQAYFSKGNTKKLIEHIEKLQPDIVHLHNLHANYINLPMIMEYLAEKDIPTVVTLYDCWFFTGKCMHYTTQGCYKWQTECKDCPQLHEGNDSWFFDRTNEVFHDRVRLFNSIPRLAIIGISDWITNECRKSAIAQNARIIQREYLWIDMEKFKMRDAKALRDKLKLEDRFVILGVAEQWGKAKGLDRFLKLADKLSDDKVIVLVGNPAPDTVFPDNVICVGRTESQEELSEYYSMADVFMTFSYQETFGKVSAEALSCGTPIICYNSTANPELVGKDCGIVVELDDKDGMLKAVDIIQKKGKDTYSAKCIEFARNNFKREKVTKEIKQVYERLLEE